MWEGVRFSSSEEVGNSLVGKFIVSKSEMVSKIQAMMSSRLRSQC